MKKILYTNFDGIDDILASMMEDTGKTRKNTEDEFSNNTKNLIKKAINRKTLYTFWNKAAGEKFGKLSYPYGMAPKYTMIIACKNATVAQELLLRKHEILTNLTPYTKSLKMTVKDLRFDPKKWDKEYVSENN